MARKPEPFAQRSAPTEPQSRGPSLHLDALEDAFGSVWKRWHARKAARRLRDRGLQPDHIARLEDYENALATVASAFAGQRILVRPAEASGGTYEGILLLPQTIGLVDDVERNARFFFVRAALGGACLASDRRPSWLAHEAEVLEHGLLTALKLSDEFPGFQKRLAAAARMELQSRPEESSVPDAEQAIEALRQSALRALLTGEDAQSEWKDALDRFRVRWGQRAPQAPSLFRRLFRSQPQRGPALAPLYLFGGVVTPSDRLDAQAASAESDPASPSEAKEERIGQIREHVSETTVEEETYKESMPTHSFEKVDFADQYEGGFRRLDGADDMEEQADSLDGLDLRQMIRGGPEAQSIYQAELSAVPEIPNVDAVAPDEKGVSYPEWDAALQRYRQDWVTLYPACIERQDVPFGIALSQQLLSTTRRSIRTLERIRRERFPRTRQPDGAEVDLDALIDEYSERLRGGHPTGRVYQHTPRIERDVATCVLLDLSFSSDSWVQNRRVLDVELAAVHVLGEVADSFGDALQVMAFASHTRNRCRTWMVKDWHEPWLRGRNRLGVLQPQGFTRIGPAIRHATDAFQRCASRQKHLIVLTDGKPTDFDRYEGNHGIQDVAYAVREARRADIQVQAIGLDPRAARVLPTMFGPGGWRILRHLEQLPNLLLQTYGG